MGENKIKQIADWVFKNKKAVIAYTVLLAIANLFVIYFIRQERFFYYWDNVGYWLKFRYFRDNLHNPLLIMKTLVCSIREDDYNYLPVFFLMPFSILFGRSRLAYILSIVNIYALPTVVSFVILHKKISKIYGFTTNMLPYIAIAVILFLPNFWQPILTGCPDVGGVFLINVIILLYLRNTLHKQSMRNLLMIAVLIPLLILFRRWYVYWAVSFYIVLLSEMCITAFFVSRLDKKNFIIISSKIFILIFVSAVFLLTLAPTFVQRITQTNYTDIYSPYRASSTLFQSFMRVLSRFGLFYFSLFILGAVCTLVNRKTRAFSILLLFQWLIIFILFSRSQDFAQHHLYLLIPTIILFSSLFVTQLISRTRRFKIFIVCGLVFLAILNFLSPFYINVFRYTIICPSIFTNIWQPPMVRNDANEIDRMLTTLEELANAQGDRVYVLASSDTFNCSILLNAYLTLNRHENIDHYIKWTHDVDKRDGFPQKFLKAKYVLVGVPIQYHLKPADQRVIGIPAELILSRKGIGTSFHKLPYEFTLDGGVKVYIYEKIKPFSDADIESLSSMFKKYYPDRKKIYEIKNEQAVLNNQK